MHNRFKRIALAALLAPSLAATGTWALAQSQQQSGSKSQQSSQQQQSQSQQQLTQWDVSRLYRNTWSAEEMLDIEVRGAKGEKIGEVEDIIVGADGTISQLVVEVGGLLEVGDQHIGVPWKDVKIAKEMGWIEVPLREVENGTYSLHGRVPQGEEVAAASKAWRVNELIGDYASLENVARYGMVTDVIFSDQGKAQGVIIDRAAGTWGAAGWYGYPYAGYYPGLVYPLPYASAEVGDYARFDYVQLSQESQYSNAGNKRAQQQQARSNRGKQQSSGASAGGGTSVQSSGKQQ
jgi:sporulation protein YlmC with PRC-barrel domain